MEQIRIAPEQEQADKNLLHNLNARLADWRTELTWTEKELMEQAIIDGKEGNKSNRYKMLEVNEKNLKANIKNAEDKLASLGERIENPTPSNPAFTGMVNNALNQMKP